MVSSPEPKRRGITILWLLGFFCLLLAFTWVLHWSQATEKVDQLIHDNWVRTNQRAVPEEVVIAAIDPASLAELGRWPWSRELQTLLFEQLAAYEVKAAVIDMLFIEPSDSSDIDRRLAAAIGSIPTTVLPILTEGMAGQSSREKLPLAVMTRQASDLGHIHLPIDNDGLVRRVFLKSGFNSPHWSALALSAYERIEGNKPYDKLPGNRVQISGLANQWETDYETLIPFFGPRGTVPNVSAASIISAKADANALRGKVVFVGLTSTGLSDVVPTPVSALDQPLPGVEIHANIYSALLERSMVGLVDSRLNILVALLLLPLMLLVYSRAKPQWGLLIAVVGGLLPILLSYVLYRFYGLWYAPLSASLPVVVSYVFWSWNRLNYLNRFLESETALLDPLTPNDPSENNLLADFFRNAELHLPINGWYFSALGQVFSGGKQRLDGSVGVLPVNRWTVSNNLYCKRYLTPGKLEIHLSIDNPALAQEFVAYVDTLARVQSRTKPSKLSGSIERLQINTLTLSDQVAWLRSMRVFNDSILEGSPAGYLVWNAVGELVRSNELAYELLPSVGEQPVLIDFIRSVSARSGDAFTDEELIPARMQSLILSSESWQMTHVDDDRETIINFNTVGDTMADRLVCATVIDVSQIRTAERGRAEMVDYLSHDLRSPLISALYLLEADEEEDDVPRESTKRIVSNINRSLRMMDDLLHVARADSLTAEGFGEVLFNSVVDNAIDQLAPQARSRSIELLVESDDEDCWMDGDAASLERAVVNVVGNAIKYSEDGDNVTIHLKKGQQFLTLIVSDEGVGIDPAMMGELFTRFKRDASIAKKFKGIGLGLALVAKVVRQHGGEVRAESPGVGTRIAMTLPLKASENYLLEDSTRPSS